MRKSQLREHLDNHLRHDHIGSFRAKKHRHFVLHKIIRDLYHIESVPGKWHALTSEQIQRLIAHWTSTHLKPSTIMKYMTVLRDFLYKIDHTIDGIDNQNLGIINRRSSKKTIQPQAVIVETFTNPVARLLFEFQTCFGLTLSEAKLLVPTIHIKEHHLWITRDIASNSQDRLIPIRFDDQTRIIGSFLTMCTPNKSLTATLGYHHVREAYSSQLISLGMAASRTYRYFYARCLHQELSHLAPNYLLNQTIMREMGIQTRMTLWSYLHE